MSKRDFRFPGETRQTSIRRTENKIGLGVLRHPLLAMLVIAAGLVVYELPGKPWEPYIKQLHALWSELSGKQRVDTERQQARDNRIKDNARIDSGQTTSRSAPEQTRPGSSGTESVQLDISIAKGFRTAGFKIAAVPQTIQLSAKPHPRIRRLPRFLAPKQRYGLIKLARGLEFVFAVDLAASGYTMYLDRNRNGNLSDDGPPLINEGRSLFASRLSFPLRVVTGIARLDGEYRIWIYTNPDSWQRSEMLYYSMTQLQGELLLKGKRYTAFLADNGPVDGDYRNDGISIDLDGSSKIDRRTEFFPRGSSAQIDGVSYNFRIVR
jgi:hypothetical protein